MEKNLNRTSALLEAMEKIMELGRNSGLSAEFYKKAGRYIRAVSSKLSMTPVQSVLLSAFINFMTDSRILLSELAQYFNCSTIRIIKNVNEIDDLERRRYIRCSRASRQRSYRVPLEVLDALKEDRPYVPESYAGMSMERLVAVLGDKFTDLEEDELTYKGFLEEVDALLAQNKELDFVKALNKYDLEDDARVMLLFLCHKRMNDDDTGISWYDYRDIYKDRLDALYMKNSMKDGDNDLFTYGLVEHCTEDGIADTSCVRLTESAVVELFGQLRMSPGNVRSRHLLHHTKIAVKELFYGSRESAQIEELTRLLAPGTFDDVCARLASKGMRKGFPCIFYGPPGTGKTETALQIARETGRDILQVEVSQLRSKWVGESEKNVKGLFDGYRAMVSQSSCPAPILLFNEADAILNRRKQGAEGGVDKMENALQNIILQEMESLEGIMIATTNLTGNMDPAFERRFLYKIEFGRPSADVRARIWQSMMPSLNADKAMELASDYNFSGGQIENIARKCSVAEVLYGTLDFTRLKAFCETERLAVTASDSKRRIGFADGWKNITPDTGKFC